MYIQYQNYLSFHSKVKPEILHRLAEERCKYVCRTIMEQFNLQNYLTLFSPFQPTASSQQNYQFCLIDWIADSHIKGILCNCFGDIIKLMSAYKELEDVLTQSDFLKSLKNDHNAGLYLLKMLNEERIFNLLQFLGGFLQKSFLFLYDEEFSLYLNENMISPAKIAEKLFEGGCQAEEFFGSPQFFVNTKEDIQNILVRYDYLIEAPTDMEFLDFVDQAGIIKCLFIQILQKIVEGEVSSITQTFQFHFDLMESLP